MLCLFKHKIENLFIIYYIAYYWIFYVFFSRFNILLCLHSFLKCDRHRIINSLQGLMARPKYGKAQILGLSLLSGKESSKLKRRWLFSFEILLFSFTDHTIFIRGSVSFKNKIWKWIWMKSEYYSETHLQNWSFLIDIFLYSHI